MSISTSPLAVLDAVWRSLHQNLWTVAQTINAELVTMGRPYALTQPNTVRQVAQVPQHPETILPAVVVRLVDDGQTGRPHTPSFTRRNLACVVEVGIYDGGTAGTINLGAGGGTIAYDAEQDAEAKLLAWAEAVRRCLQRPYAQGGVHGTAGILRAEQTSRARELFLQENGIITASCEILTFTIESKAT